MDRKYQIIMAVIVVIIIAAAAAEDVAKVKIAIQNVQQDKYQNDDPGFVLVFTAGHEKTSL